MPRGPQGQERPADSNQCAVMVAKIATGEIEDELPSDKRNGGIAGAAARAESLTPEQRSEIARKAAKARWSK